MKKLRDKLIDTLIKNNFDASNIYLNGDDGLELELKEANVKCIFCDACELERENKLDCYFLICVRIQVSEDSNEERLIEICNQANSYHPYYTHYFYEDDAGNKYCHIFYRMDISNKKVAHLNAYFCISDLLDEMTYFTKNHLI